MHCTILWIYIFLFSKRARTCVPYSSSIFLKEPSWRDRNWIYNYLRNRCLSPLIVWVRISIRVRCTTLCDNNFQWLAADWWFSPGPPVSSTDKTDRCNIAEILLKVALSTIKQTNIFPTFTIHVIVTNFESIYSKWVKSGLIFLLDLHQNIYTPFWYHKGYIDTTCWFYSLRKDVFNGQHNKSDISLRNFCILSLL